MNIELIDICKNVLRQEINALESTYNKVGNNFAEAVQLICNSNKVIVSGVGKSGIIGKKISATFSSIGISSVFLHPVEALHGDIGMVQDDDVVILLSKSGTTDEIIRFLPYIKMRSAKIISILGNTKSFIARHSEIVLDASVEKEACPFNLAPTTSSTVALAIGDALAIASMKFKNVTLEDFSRLHPLGQIGRNITVKVKDIMHTNENLPLISTYAPFKNAIIEITNKDLGCVCVVDEEQNLIGLITDGDVRRVLQNSDDLRELNVSSVMTRNPITIKPEAFLGEALKVMENRTSEINVLPVIEDNKKLVGLIRLHDIIRTGV